MDVGPTGHGFGLFGPDFGFPGGGLCLSTFLIVERDRLVPGDLDMLHGELLDHLGTPV